MNEGELDELVRAHGSVITTQKLREAGVTRSGLEWARSKGKLRPLRKGVYTSAGIWAEASPTIKHGLEVLAQQRVSPELVACGLSAAALLGLPLPSGVPSIPQLVAAREGLPGSGGDRGGGNRSRGKRGGTLARRSWLSEREIRTLPAGTRVTSPLRTPLDCARELDEPWGLAIADAAIARFKLSPERLVSAAAARSSVPGGRRARWVAEHARRDVESPLESLGRGVIVLAGFPEPTPQAWLKTRIGWRRVDMLDKANRVITEADGKIKYAQGDDLWREKRREDALRELGFEVIRFTMLDYHCQDAWLAVYQDAISRSASRSARALPPENT